jgi:branched-chain amino acid transport system substrate-binding protein
MTRLVVLLLALGLFLPANPQASGSIKIGVFLSLTGATAAYGISASNAIKLATDEVNRNGGIDGQMIEFVVEDDHSNTQEVSGIVNKLINQDKVDALIAEPVSTRAMIAAPIAQRNRVVMISSASVKPELTRQGDYIFRACFISSREAEAIAKFAVRKLKAKKAAMILDYGNDYAMVLGKFFIDSFAKLGGQVVSQQGYSAGDTEIKAQLSSILALKPDIIFAPGFYTTAPMVTRAVKQSGFKGILIGSDGWDSPRLLEAGSEPFEGVYFANHFWAGSDNARVKKFVANYRAKYGHDPDAGAATAYDAAHMLFDAFKRAKSKERSAVRDALAQTKDFAGVTGMITLDPNRDAQVPVYMLRIEKGGKFTLQAEF